APPVVQVDGRPTRVARDVVADARLVAAVPGPGKRTGRAGEQPLAQVFHGDDKGFFDGIFLPLPAPPVAATGSAHPGPLTPWIFPKSIGFYALYRLPALAFQPICYSPKLLQRCLKIVGDVLGEFIRLGQVLGVFQVLVPDPEDVEVQLVALG